MIVTGSRNWADYLSIFLELQQTNPDLVVHGAARGADTATALACEEIGIPELPMPAQWSRDGKAAGPLRNAEMLRVLLALRMCGWEVEVLAFPLGESKGTHDMIDRAKRAGISVTIWEER